MPVDTDFRERQGGSAQQTAAEGCYEACTASQSA